MPTADEQAVLETNLAFYRAFQTMDYEAMNELWARSVPVASVHPLGALVRGREDVMEAWRLILSNPDQPLVLSGDARAVVTDTFAYVTCREVAGGTPAGVDEPVRPRGRRVAHRASSFKPGGAGVGTVRIAAASDMVPRRARTDPTRGTYHPRVNA